MHRNRRSTSVIRARSAPSQRSVVTRKDASPIVYGGLENFTIQAPVGQGQFATVWRALHQPTGRMVAMKRVKVGC